MKDSDFFRQLVLLFSEKMQGSALSDEGMATIVTNKALAVYNKAIETEKQNRIGVFYVSSEDIMKATIACSEERMRRI